MQFRRQIPQEDGINLTPLIDVVFLLLIFFMVSTTFTKEAHLQVQLPEATQTVMAKPQETPIEVVIQADGHYFINGEPLALQSKKGLFTQLERLVSVQPERPLAITADASTPHQAVVNVMDVAGRLGVSSLRMTTQVEASGK